MKKKDAWNGRKVNECSVDVIERVYSNARMFHRYNDDDDHTEL